MKPIVSIFLLNLFYPVALWQIVYLLTGKIRAIKSSFYLHYFPFLIAIFYVLPDRYISNSYLLFSDVNSTFESTFHYLIPSNSNWFPFSFFIYNLIYYGISLKVLYNFFKKRKKNNQYKIKIHCISCLGLILLCMCLNLGDLVIPLNASIQLSTLILIKKIVAFTFLVAIFYLSNKLFDTNFTYTNSAVKNPMYLSDILPKIKTSNVNIEIDNFWKNESKIYLTNGFNLTKMSKHLKIDKKVLTKTLYDIYQLNFNDILNRYRIYHIFLNLKEDVKRKKNIELISQECGYKNRSTFYLAFKKISKLSPLEFNKQIVRD